jgi:hypothetical protein
VHPATPITATTPPPDDGPAYPNKKLKREVSPDPPEPVAVSTAMASDASDEDIFDYEDEGVSGSDIDFDDGDSSINDGTPPLLVNY